MKPNYEIRGNVAVITLNNPPVNGLGFETRVGIAEGLNAAQADPQVKSIVVTGSARAFSGGADINEFGSSKSVAEPNLLTLILALESSSKPTIAAVQGICMGGGLELALGCHYRVAAPGAQVALPEVKIGLIPGAGGTQRLPRAVSKAKAMDLVLTGRMMDAAEAERSGLVSRVVPADQLMDVALAAASTICELGALSLMAAKECVNRAYEGTLADGILVERRLFQALFATEDKAEGTAAFLDKRKPVFKHR